MLSSVDNRATPNRTDDIRRLCTLQTAAVKKDNGLARLRIIRPVARAKVDSEPPDTILIEFVKP